MSKAFGTLGGRYLIQAKRKDEDDKKWSEWTEVDHFKDAVAHAKHVEELGHCGRVVPREFGILKLWEILGGDTDKADEILDAGFRLQEATATTIFRAINRVFDKDLRALNEEINLHDEVGNEGSALELKKQRAVLENAFELIHAIEKCYVKEKEDEES